MNAEPARSVSNLLTDHARVTDAIGRAVRKALLEHARAGNPVASWEDGKVVWLSPREIFARLGDEPPARG